MCSTRFLDIYTQSILHAMDMTFRAVTTLPCRIEKIQSTLEMPFKMVSHRPNPPSLGDRKKGIILFPYKRVIREPYVKGLSRHILTRQKRVGLRYSAVSLTTVPLLPHGDEGFNCFRFSCQLRERPALPAASHMLVPCKVQNCIKNMI